MTTWVNSQFPRPDFHRQVQRHYGLQNSDFIFDSPAVLANLRRHGKHPLPQFLGILDPLASPALKHNEPVGGPDAVVILNQDEIDPKLNEVPRLHLLR